MDVHRLIIQQWTSLGTTLTGTPSGMIKLQGNQYYEILAAAKTNTASSTLTSKIQLQWASRSHSQSIVPSSRLFLSWHVAGSPFPLGVVPNQACTATMRVFQSGVSRATAGVMASFTIQSRDSYDNVRSTDFVEGLGRVLNWTIIGPAEVVPRAQGNAPYIGAGRYQVNYTTVTSGYPSIDVMLLTAGGLNGTYYENEDLTDHPTAPDGTPTNSSPYSRMDPVVDFFWGPGRPLGPPTNGTGRLVDSGVLFVGDTVPPYDHATLDPITASPVAGAYLNFVLLVNGEQRTISSSSLDRTYGIATGGSASLMYVNLASSAVAVDDYYTGYNLTIYDGSGTTFTSGIITSYFGVNRSAYITALNGNPTGKFYYLDGSRVVRVSRGFAAPLLGGSPYAIYDVSQAKDIGPDYFSVKWEGMIQPRFSEVYTYHIYCDDGAKMWVNGLLILDFWYARGSEVDGTIALMAGTLYPVTLIYKEILGDAAVSMRWSSRSEPKNVIPSSVLYSWIPVYGPSGLDVEPAIACASASSVTGQGLSTGTAGVQASFIIQSRDEYMNDRDIADAGIRPGYVGYGKLVFWGTATFTSATVVTLSSPASAQAEAYKGFVLSYDNTGEQRVIADYTAAGVATLVSPFSTVPIGSSGNCKIIDLTTPDNTTLQAYYLGYPEWHTQITPIVDGSSSTIHAVPIRLSSYEYPGGLTATYYDDTPDDNYLIGQYNVDILTSPRWSTWCSTSRPCDYTIDFSETINFKRKIYGAGCGVNFVNLAHAGAVLSAGNTSLVNLALTASADYEAYQNYSIRFLDGSCRGRWAKITDYPASLKVAVLENNASTWSDGGAWCISQANDLYEIYQFASIPSTCTAGTPLTRGWTAAEPSETPQASLIDSAYTVRWTGFVSAAAAGVYTFYADLPTATASGATDDRVKLWIDSQLVSTFLLFYNSRI